MSTAAGLSLVFNLVQYLISWSVDDEGEDAETARQAQAYTALSRVNTLHSIR